MKSIFSKSDENVDAVKLAVEKTAAYKLFIQFRSKIKFNRAAIHISFQYYQNKTFQNCYHLFDLFDKLNYYCFEKLCVQKLI